MRQQFPVGRNPATGWLPQRDQLPATYASEYSSRFTDQEAWYRIDAVSAQVHDLDERDPRRVWSGDIAADWVRPWKIPTTAIAYGSVPAGCMDECGFVRADSAATASMLVRPFPDDRFADEAEQLDGLRVAPRLHLVADLIGLGGDDRVEAASRFAERESSPS